MLLPLPEAQSTTKSTSQCPNAIVCYKKVSPPPLSYLTGIGARLPGNGNLDIDVTSIVAYNPIDYTDPISLIHIPSGILFSLNVTMTTTFDMEPYGP